MRLGEVVTGGPGPRSHPSAASSIFGLSSATSNNMKGKKSKPQISFQRGLETKVYPHLTIFCSRFRGPLYTTELVAMTGELDSGPAMGNPKIHSMTRKTMLAAAAVAPPESIDPPSDPDDAYDLDPNQDDELSNIIDDPSLAHHQYLKTAQIIQPVIQVFSESSSLSHQKDANRAQHITCMVSVEIPSRYPTTSMIPTPASASFSSINSPLYNSSYLSSPGSALSQPSLPSIFSPVDCDNARSARSPECGRGFTKVRSYPTLASAAPSVRSEKASSPSAGQEKEMRNTVAEDLLSRIQNWKGRCPFQPCDISFVSYNL